MCRLAAGGLVKLTYRGLGPPMTISLATALLVFGHLVVESYHISNLGLRSSQRINSLRHDQRGNRTPVCATGPSRVKLRSINRVHTPKHVQVLVTAKPTVPARAGP